MLSLKHGYRAAVIGATGAIGGAVARRLQADPRAGEVMRFGRSASDADFRIDLESEPSIRAAAARAGAVDLLFVATGALRLTAKGGPPEGKAFEPEKALARLDPQALAAQFAVNAIGPALVLKHFAKNQPRGDRALAAVLSARVGSIGDNRLGGWHGYRAAKAALNQYVRTIAIELRRTHPKLVLAALHPGTVESPLSAPFRPEGAARPDILTPENSAAALLRVLDSLADRQSGGFYDYRGRAIEW